jgi:hypothetical protein
MKVALTIGVLGIFLVVSAIYSFRIWNAGETSLGMHGWIAIGIGVVVTFGVGAGLMTLVFYSSRKGYDERQDDWARGHRGEDPRP